MKHIITILAFLIVMMITYTTQCHSKTNKEISRKLIRVKCPANDDTYSKLIVKDLKNMEFEAKFVSELCTQTHRLAVIKTRNSRLKAHTLDELLSTVLTDANTKIAIYDNVKLTQKNVFRLQRKMIESAFFEVYKKSTPNSLAIKFSEDTYGDDNDTVKMLDSLKDIYDNVLIKFFVIKTQENANLLIIVPY